METTTPRHRSKATRVAVSFADPALAAEHWDYADAFEIRVRASDPRSSEEAARAALEEAPVVIRWIVWNAHRHVLRFQQGPRSSPDHVFGWTIVSSTPERIHLTAESPLVRAAIIGRRPTSTSVVVTTCLSYRRPVAARLVQTIIGPLHRAIAPRLLEHAAAVEVDR